MEKEKFEIILNKHSGLTSYFKLKGDKISPNAHKVIFNLLAEEQSKLKEQFSEEFKKVAKKIFYHNDDKELDDIFSNIYSKKKIDFSKHKIDSDEVFNIINEIVEDKKKYFLSSKDESKIKATMLKEFIDSYIAKIYSNTHSNLIEFFDKEKKKYEIVDSKIKKKIMLPIDKKFDNNQINALMTEIKEWIQEKVVIDATKYEKRIDLTQLANELNTNITRLKKEISSASQTFLKFNYLNKKKLNIDVQSSFISSVAFNEQKDFTILEYEIPKKIINLLLNPDMFVSVHGLTLKKLSDPVAIDLYQFLKDHLLRGYVEVTKEDFFGFIECNKKCQSNKYDLETRVLKPALDQINLYTEISVEYEFVPQKRWKSLMFRIKRNTQSKTMDKLKIVNASEKVTLDYKEVPKVLKAAQHARKNLYVNKAWKTDGDRKVNRLLNTIGEEATIEILNRLYSSLNNPIETTITQYINGIVKNYEKENKLERKKNTRQTKKKSTEKDKKLLEKELNKKDDKKEETVKSTTDTRKNKVVSIADVIQENIPKQYLDNKEDDFDYDAFIELVDKEKDSGRSVKKVDMKIDRYNRLIARYEELKKDIPLSFLSIWKINFIE